MSDTNLARLQRALQDRIVHGEVDGLDLARSDDAARVGIYASAYRLRLQDALSANFPMLQTHLSPSVFASLALEYLDAHPSRDPSIRTFGLHLAQWLCSSRAQEPWLAELARFEWALGQAFDAIDAATLQSASLAGIAPDEWPSLTFHFARTTQRLTLSTNAAELYRAAVSDAPAGEGRATAASEWLIWRRALQSQYRSISAAEAAAIDALLGGGTFGDACEEVAIHYDAAAVPSRAASFLKRWLEDELIAGVEHD